MGQQDGTADKTLAGWRKQIDKLDGELLRLLNQRAAVACEIAVVKVTAGLPAYDGLREKYVLDRIAAKNTGPLENESVVAIFSSIIHETRRLGTRRMQEQGRAQTMKAQKPSHRQSAKS